MADFSLTLEGGDEPTAHDYAAVMAKIQGETYQHLVQTVLLRSMNQAVYQPENKGHFGLNYEHYTHFTSPIRRYPDLLIHRAIAHVWTKKGPELFDYTETQMQALGQHCSDTERRADEATRDAVTFLKCEFLSHRLGQEFEAVVTAATNFGLFVEIDPLYVEGLVHITELGEDYFHYDNARHCLKGERTGKVYRLGDRVRVQVAQVNLDDRKVDLRFVATESSLTPSNETDELNDELADGDEAPKRAKKKRFYRKKKTSSKAGA
ncbi:RNB domain-containing ribonuclease [Thiomicrorhabdus aquaedulcis]|uniref:RNB domain-containing ribonuclease n=1 Tax=Thiomicrorhabdus aquaedulcis TaxID=2211106 RepID=UPI0030B8363B